MYAPQIDPVLEELRPRWSVMIPAYEGAEYLAKTIRSVLVQDPGPELMQIEVVDDHSVKEDLRTVVEQVGRGRVAYYRQPQNAGAIKNFNTCIERSRGEWVHILHGDDMVMLGFYEKLRVATQTPGVGAAFCRVVTMNEDDHWMRISGLELNCAGVLPKWIERIGVVNNLFTPSIIVAREVYEHMGGYDTRMYHCADWDMWKRIACSYPVWFEPTVLACYREHSKSDTSRLVRSGRNIEDMRRSITIAKQYLPQQDAERLTRQAHKVCASYALSVARLMFRRRDFLGAWAQSREALMTSRTAGVFASVVSMPAREGAAFLGRLAVRLCRRAVQFRRIDLAAPNSK